MPMLKRNLPTAIIMAWVSGRILSQLYIGIRRLQDKDMLQQTEVLQSVTRMAKDVQPTTLLLPSYIVLPLKKVMQNPNITLQRCFSMVGEWRKIQ